MKISSKLVRRTFLLLSPFLLGITLKGCIVLDIIILTLCSFAPFVPQGTYGISPSGKQLYLDQAGEILQRTSPCIFFSVSTVPGKPVLYDITYQGVDSVGNIVVGANGTIFLYLQLSGFIISNPAGTQDLYAIDQDLPSPNVIAVGDGGTVIKSTDNGLSWSVVNFPSSDDLRTCEIRGDYILVGGGNYSAYQSEDCGETWEQINIGDNYNSFGPTSFNAIFFVDENVGYMGGPFGLMGKTTDGGANWIFFAAPDFEEVYDLFFISPDSGVVVGKPSMVRFTADGGDSWEEDPEITNLLAGSSIKNIGAVSEEYGVAITDSGLVIDFTTDSTLLTAVNEDGIHIHNYSLSNNYPNPFNPSTIIEYSLPQYGFVTLIIYDMLGREIATLVNEEKPIGSYEVEFDATGLTSGIYFYRLRAGDPESSLPVGQTGSGQGFVETKKMILLR